MLVAWSAYGVGWAYWATQVSQWVLLPQRTSSHGACVCVCVCVCLVMAPVSESTAQDVVPHVCSAWRSVDGVAATGHCRVHRLP